MARHWFHGRFQASALPLVKLWAVLRSAGHPEGPGSLARHWIRSGSRLPFGPLVRMILPAKPESGAQTCDVQIVNLRPSLPTVGNVASKAPPGLSSRSGPASSQFPSPSGLRKLKSPPEGRGAHGGTGPPVRADLPRRGGPSAEGPRPLHPPLDGCRPARGPGGLPGRSLSLSLGRESEARTSGATGVLLE